MEFTRIGIYSFKKLIESHDIGEVMPAHIIYPEIDPYYTAGTSKIWLNEILREQFHFEGLIIFDCKIL